MTSVSFRSIKFVKSGPYNTSGQNKLVLHLRRSVRPSHLKFTSM